MNTHTMNIHNCTAVTISTPMALTRPSDGAVFYVQDYRFEHADGSHLTISTLCEKPTPPLMATE